MEQDHVKNETEYTLRNTCQHKQKYGFEHFYFFNCQLQQPQKDVLEQRTELKPDCKFPHTLVLNIEENNNLIDRDEKLNLFVVK